VSLRILGRRAPLAVGLAGLVAAAVVAGAASASASTIPNGHIQICAQGDYPVFIHVLSEPIPNSGGATTQSFESPVVSPNQGSNSCWWNQNSFSTGGQQVQVDVVGVHQNGSQFYIRSERWNGSSGLGIGAEGSESSPWVETW
jgi:hypothetical protein